MRLQFLEIVYVCKMLQDYVKLQRSLILQTDFKYIDTRKARSHSSITKVKICHVSIKRTVRDKLYLSRSQFHAKVHTRITGKSRRGP